MTLAVALVGLFIVGIAVIGVIQPRRLVGWADSVWSRDLLWLAVGTRLALGALLIAAAPECRMPEAVRVLGWVAILAAVALVFLGSRRMNDVVQWWIRRPPGIVRVWSAAGVLFGGFLMYAGM